MRPSPHDDALQLQARALGDPTRFAIFRHIAERDRPTDVATLTELLGLNHNAVRQHLGKLLHAGLVEESTEHRGGRGRPRLVYRAEPSAVGRWLAGGPYEQLSVLLTKALATGRSPAEVGREWAARTIAPPSPDTDPVEPVVAAMARQGFDPLVRRRGERVEVVLRACPFEAAALVDPDVVCGLHLGMAEGIAACTGGEVTVEALTPHDPRRANCRLRLRIAPAAATGSPQTTPPDWERPDYR